MGCDETDSKELVKAVCEQAEVVQELGGFNSDEDCDQFLRDARDAARKLYVAEQVIAASDMTAVYQKALKRGVIESS